jgi:hypothetical protein
MLFIVTDDATTARGKIGLPLRGRPERRAGGVAGLARGTTPRFILLLPSAPLRTITSLQSG